MKKLFLLLSLLLTVGLLTNTYSQRVAINATGSDPDTSSILDISSSTGGLLIPRMTTAQQNAIPLPATGLMIFNTTDNQFKYNSGTSALPVFETVLSSAAAWSTTGNTAIVDGVNFLGTTTNIPLTIKVNNQKAGRIDNTNGITSLGYQSLNNNTGINNTAIGKAGLFTNVTGVGNTAVGYQAGYSNTTDNNSFFGFQSGYFNSTGSGITAGGYRALYNNTTGTTNTAFGTSALQANTTASYNTAFGANTLQANTSGQTNTAVGQFSLGTNNSGNGNTAIGQSAMPVSTTGNYNSALGASSLNNNIGGISNTAIGHSAMYRNTTGNNNTVVGQNALSYSVTGSNKVAVGYQAGYNDSLGNNNNFIGFQSDNGVGKTTALTNATAIGYQAKVNTSNSLVLGGIGANAVSVGIGTQSPTAALDVVGKTKTATFQLTTTPAIGYVLTSDATGNGTWQASAGGGGGWGTTGNTGTSSATNFIGTTDSVSFRIRTNNTEKMVIDSTGKVGVGTTSPTQKFHVVSTDTAKSVIAATTTVIGQYENTNAGGTSVDLKAINSSHTLTTRIGINPTYSSTGGNGVMAWYANYDGNFKIIHMYDYVNNNYMLAPNIAGYTVSKVGIGLAQASIGSILTVNGGFAVANGATSFSTTTAPGGGAIIEGRVGIGTTSPQTALHLNGGFTLERDSVSLTANNQPITIDDNSSLFITSNNNTVANRVFTLSSGLNSGQLLYIIFLGAASQAQLNDAGNCKLNGNMVFDADNTISLMWNGSSWVELARSLN